AAPPDDARDLGGAREGDQRGGLARVLEVAEQGAGRERIRGRLLVQHAGRTSGRGQHGERESESGSSNPGSHAIRLLGKHLSRLERNAHASTANSPSLPE